MSGPCICVYVDDPDWHMFQITVCTGLGKTYASNPIFNKVRMGMLKEQAWIDIHDSPVLSCLENAAPG